MFHQLNHSLLLVRVLANRLLKLFDTLGHADDFLFESSLLGLEVAQLLVEADRLCTHGTIMPVDLFLHAVELVGQGLARVLALHCQHVLKSLLLTAQDLNLLLVGVQVLVEHATSLSEVRELALKMGGVLVALHLADRRVSFSTMITSS